MFCEYYKVEPSLLGGLLSFFYWFVTDILIFKIIDLNILTYDIVSERRMGQICKG